MEVEEPSPAAELARCTQKIARHDREIRMVWAHHEHMRNYAATLEEENAELKIENELLKEKIAELYHKRNVRRAVFLETPEARMYNKRQKKSTEAEVDSESEEESDEADDWRKRKNQYDDDDDITRKRLKKVQLIEEQSRKRPVAWGAVTPDELMSTMAVAESCTHCGRDATAYKTEHFFCGTECYTTFYRGFFPGQ